MHNATACVPLALYQLYAGPVASLLGLIDPRTQTDIPEVPTTVTGTAQLDWTLGGYHTTIFGHSINGFHDFDLDGNDRRVGSSVTWDLQVSYTMRDQFGAYLKDTTVSLGAFNILDCQPPLSQYCGNNPNNYPGFIYTSEGRMWYVSLGKKF